MVEEGASHPKAEGHHISQADRGGISVVAGDNTKVNIAPPTPPTDPPLQCPPRADYFTNREQKLAQLLTDLQPGRVVTLAGPGGMGKTALAAEVVANLVVDNKPPERFPDGVFFHSFYNQPDVNVALESLALAFGEEPRPTAQIAAQRALSGKQALLVLDGTEDADNLGVVLAVRGQCGVLVTSRNRADAPAILQDLEPLAADDAVKLLQAWAEAQLDDQPAAVTVCQLVGRLPLAVRLVGRYLRSTQETVSEYLTTLEKTPLGALDRGKRRRESVPVLLAKSLGQVSGEAQQVLGLVGLLALASFRREIVAAVFEVEENQVGQWLGELVTYGLLNRGVEGAYEVSHALIHTYARERLRVAPERANRLITIYDALARHYSKQGLDDYTPFDAERVHMIRLIEGCAKREEWASVCQLVWALYGYLENQGHPTDLQTVLTLGVKAAQQLGDQRNEGAFLGSLGLAYYDLGRVTEAIDYHQRALAIDCEIEHRRGEGADLGNLGIAYYALGQVSEAIDHYEQALAIAREIGHRQMEGNTLGNLGLAYYDLGQVEQAIDYHQQALAIDREIEYRKGEGDDLGNLGNAYAALGQIPKAIDCLEQALTIHCEDGYRYGEGGYLGDLGNVYRILGQVSEAIDYLKQALAIARQTGYRRNEGNHLGALGNVYRDLGQISEAIDHYERALAIAREIGDRRGEGNWLGNLGLAYYTLGQVEQAIDYYEQALAIAMTIAYRHGEGAIVCNLGLAYRDLGEVGRARASLEQALQIFEEIKSPNADLVRQWLDELDAAA